MTSDDDYTFGGSELDFYRDVPAAVGQAAKTRLLLFLGEWFLNIEEGTPYFLGILGKHSKATADATIQNRVLGTQGMVNIKNYESTVDADLRLMTASMDINTVFGPTTVQIANYVNF